MYIVRNKKFTILAGAIMVFIFMQSALPADLSSEESGVIVDWIMKVMENILPFGRETVVFAVRKGAHFTEYLIFGAVLMQAVKEWRAAPRLSGNSAATAELPKAGEGLSKAAPGLFMAGGMPAAWLIGTAYALTDEFHQSFVPGRSCELRDVVIDSCGVLTGVLAATLAGWIRVRRIEARQDSSTRK